MAPSGSPSLSEMIDGRLSRRAALAGAAGVAALSSAACTDAKTATGPFAFKELPAGFDQTHHVAEGYRADVLIRWGDPVTRDAPPFDPTRPTPASLAAQFGYNNDYLGYFPLPLGSANGEHGLLCVNHEDTALALMIPDPEALTPEEYVAIDKAAHGLAVIEIKKTAGKWQVVQDSAYARRHTPLDGVCAVSGPAAGDARMRTNADPEGRAVIGTFGNCAGGVTPWGTYLTAEENIFYYFLGDVAGLAQEKQYRRYSIPSAGHAWGTVDARFDVTKEPNEPNRFGWIVELDPYDPAAVPVKRTALGRFFHEGAECVVNTDGRIVLYSGDDARFEYVYRFVSAGRYDPANRAANKDLFDTGTLSVARFDADGQVHWMPLVFGQGPLTPENGFRSQADVVIDCRQAADALGATPMDRPEGMIPNPTTGRAYLSLTLNERRKADQTDKANPRKTNFYGHILELVPPNGDHAADSFAWDVLVLCGPPQDEGAGAKWNPAITDSGWFMNPDNIAVDPSGRIWVATDGNNPAYVWADRRSVGNGNRGRRARPGPRLFPVPGRCRALRSAVYAGWQDVVRLRATSRSRRRAHAAGVQAYIDVCGSIDTLARF